MKNVRAIILAAGRGIRMKSDTPKVLHHVHLRPMLEYPVKALESAGVDKTILVLGYKNKEVKKIFTSLESVIQKRLLGSGDAVKITKKLFKKFKGKILVLCGDTPLIMKDTITKILKEHEREKASVTLLTAFVECAYGYGRISRDASGRIIGIIEEKDANRREKEIKEINVGCYCFEKDELFSSLDKLKINAKKKEYYLTDVVEILKMKNKKISSVLCKDSYEALGINSRHDLATAGRIINNKVLQRLMKAGVTIVDPRSTFVDSSAKIGTDTIIYPNTVIDKNVSVGKNCSIGPFARLREGTKLENSVEVGNFVELVRTRVSSGTKIKHLTYLGDADLGKNVNVGAGVITANYDGKNKNKTIIESEAFIGVGAILIAPVKVGRGAIVGAGSVVTKKKNVPRGKTVIGAPARILK